MNRRDLIGISIRNLLRRKTRTFLAITGVVVGTSAIIVMLSIGFGLSVNFQEQIESYGNLHLINVYSGGGFSGPGGPGIMENGKPAILDDKAIAAFEKIKGVDGASPRIDEFLTLGIDKYIAQVSVVGIRPEIMQKFNYELQEGRLLQPGDKYAIVFGNQVPIWFYNPKKTLYSAWTGEPQVDVITDKIILTGDYEYGQTRRSGDGGGEKINYKQYKGKGVGILANPDDESAYFAYMNFDTLKNIQADNQKARKEPSNNQQGYNQAMVYVRDINKVQKVSDTIREMGFQTSSLSDWLKAMQDQARMIQGILGGIGAISLLVAALGITNTMIMSIYERTKEIGVMKVIGANLADIRRLFLLESGMIGFLGGLAGILFSFIISFLMNTVFADALSMLMGSIGGGGSTISIIPWWVAVGALGFATAIGLISGYSPARRAMRLSALESLRNE
ncbi:MAG: ABC transporter permease [Eubacteriales bacterium]|nr:ABC transporter permease [Eubacteriales bacterium]MDD4583114.1 ABC transporter permease [Eubacteriales bacterium]